MVDATRCFFFFFFFFFFGCTVASRGGYQMARGRHYAKLSLSNAARLSFSDLCILLFMFLSLCRLCVCVFLCSHWSLVDVPLIFFCPADHVPDWQPRVLLGMVEARSVNVKKTTTTTVPCILLTHRIIDAETSKPRQPQLFEYCLLSVELFYFFVIYGCRFVKPIPVTRVKDKKLIPHYVSCFLAQTISCIPS